jgi:hypothetical protein
VTHFQMTMLLVQITFFCEEEQASDEVDEPHPEEKKKGGRKYTNWIDLISYF